jgi:NADH:ubiquinone oxidoreductase subunit 5 (subunit L)/multisubunit Na+/H+ antiporter MnhA subunit
MTGPLAVLAVAAVGLGAPVLPSSYGVSSWLDAPAGTGGLDVSAAGVLLTCGLALLGASATAAAFLLDPDADPVLRLGRVATFLRRGMRVDDLYSATVVRPTRTLAARTLRTDVGGVDGAVRGSGVGVQLAARAVAPSQRGNVQSYATGLLLAVVVLVVSVAVSR